MGSDSDDCDFKFKILERLTHLVMASGFGVNGGTGRCYPFFQEYVTCIRSAELASSCTEKREVPPSLLVPIFGCSLPCHLLRPKLICFLRNTKCFIFIYIILAVMSLIEILS
jgi:hypothetical protein